MDVAAPYHNILSKNDRALVAYLISVSAGLKADTLPAKLSQNKTLPNTVVWSEKFTEMSPFSGVYDIDVNIIVRTKALGATPTLTSDARAAAVFDAFKMDVDSGSDKLAADITATARAAAVADPTNNGDLADYTCQAVNWSGGECGFDEAKDDVWTDTLMLKVTACPSNVS